MKKIMNTPDNYVSECLQAIYAVHGNELAYVNDDLHCLIRKHKTCKKVALITGGGSGHLPLFLGYVGEGMLDGCAIGDIFQSPNPEQIVNVGRALDTGDGILFIYGNYNGDIFNFDMAADLLHFEENIRCETVLCADDISSPPPADGQKSLRRGVAGIFFVFKCAGAAALNGHTLDEVKRVAEKTASEVRTLGVALSPCVVPRVGKASFLLSDDEMEIGIGIHGEPGLRRGKLKTADEITDEILEQLMGDLNLVAGDQVAVLINGLGSTPLEEQYIVYRRVDMVLAGLGIEISKAYVGEFATSMEMSGFSISLCRLDSELKELLLASASTPFFKQ